MLAQTRGAQPARRATHTITSRPSAAPVALLLALSLALAACQTVPDAPAGATTERQSAPQVRPKVDTKLRSAPRATGAPASVEAPAPTPDETIRIAPGETTLSPEMESRLDRVLQRVKPNEQLRIRLEAYSPERGSNAWEIAMAEKSLQTVRARLIAQGIRPFRIETTMVGDRAGTAAARERNEVRLYIIEPSSN